MPLTTTQINELVEKLVEWWNPARLQVFADSLDVNLLNLAPGANMQESARKFIMHMNSARPPRDRILLEELHRQGNASLQETTRELMKRPFVTSPDSNDAHDAILLGDLEADSDHVMPFVDRNELRKKIRLFTRNLGVYSPHVLIVRGVQPCGKSYSWYYLRHLADQYGVAAKPVRLSEGVSKPYDLVRRLAERLQLDTSSLPQMTDDPQLSRVRPLVCWFMDELDRLTQPYWLVIDELNDSRVTQPVLETVYELAFRVEDEKPKNLWLILLGYNLPIATPDFRPAEESAEFPDVSSVARHFQWVASPVRPLTPEDAKMYAAVLFSAYSQLNKEAMQELAKAILKMDLALHRGNRPGEQL